MLEFLMIVMIYAGVAIAIYQLYDIYCNQSQSIEEEDDKTHAVRKSLKRLAVKAEQYRSGESSGFSQAVKDIYGPDIDPRLVLAAFASEQPQSTAEALLRRKHKVVANGRIKIQQLPFWKTNPPTLDIRGALLTVIIANSLGVLFLGGLGVYTMAYEVSIASLAWANSSVVLVMLIYALIVLTHLLAKFDSYMHDIHQIGKLNERLAGKEQPISHA